MNARLLQFAVAAGGLWMMLGAECTPSVFESPGPSGSDGDNGNGSVTSTIPAGLYSSEIDEHTSTGLRYRLTIRSTSTGQVIDEQEGAAWAAISFDNDGWPLGLSVEGSRDCHFRLFTGYTDGERTVTGVTRLSNGIRIDCDELLNGRAVGTSTDIYRYDPDSTAGAGQLAGPYRLSFQRTVNLTPSADETWLTEVDGWLAGPAPDSTPMCSVGGSNTEPEDPGDGNTGPSPSSDPYQEDFSADPSWTTNAPSALHWDQASGAWYFHNDKTTDQYAYFSIDWEPGRAYKLAFDIMLTRSDWGSNVNFGFWDDAMKSEGDDRSVQAVARYGHVDQGRSAILLFLDSDGNSYYANGRQPAPFSLNVWYHNELMYDPRVPEMRLTVTRASDGSFVGQERITQVGQFSGISRIGISNVGDRCCPGVAEGYIDNVTVYALP